MSLSFDTNVLLPAVEATNVHHRAASRFLASLASRDDVVISELALIEFYVLLRNPAVVPRARTPAEAVEICQSLRNNPAWRMVGLPRASREFHDSMWLALRQPNLARRRAYDIRLALSLIAHGVDEFATVNLRDFEGLGFKRVWNPLAE